jgi:anti-anti-sigma factor
MREHGAHEPAKIRGRAPHRVLTRTDDVFGKHRVIWADRLAPVDVGMVALDLNLHVQGRIGGGMVIVARGDLDHGAVERFRACVDQVLQPPPGTLYVDVRLVTFVDSSGIGALVFSHKQAERVGTRLVLQHPSDALLRTLRTVDLLGFFGLPPT